MREIAGNGVRRQFTMRHRNCESLGAFANAVLLEGEIDIPRLHRAVAVAANSELSRGGCDISADGDIVGNTA